MSQKHYPINWDHIGRMSGGYSLSLYLAKTYKLEGSLEGVRLQILEDSGIRVTPECIRKKMIDLGLYVVKKSTNKPRSPYLGTKTECLKCGKIGYVPDGLHFCPTCHMDNCTNYAGYEPEALIY